MLKRGQNSTFERPKLSKQIAMANNMKISCVKKLVWNYFICSHCQQTENNQYNQYRLGSWSGL